jgi:hypothetical protein
MEALIAIANSTSSLLGVDDPEAAEHEFIGNGFGVGALTGRAGTMLAT